MLMMWKTKMRIRLSDKVQRLLQLREMVRYAVGLYMLRREARVSSANTMTVLDPV